MSASEAVRAIAPWMEGFAEGCGGPQADGGIYAAECLLEAFADDRFAVVKLPEPSVIPASWDSACLGAWEAINFGADPVSAWPDVRRGVALPDGTFISAEAARDLAAALLAAADAAEAHR